MIINIPYLIKEQIDIKEYIGYIIIMYLYYVRTCRLLLRAT